MGGRQDPNVINYSQTTAGGRGRYEVIKKSMSEKGWDGGPIDVVKTPEGYVSIDNTRLLVARELGLEKVPVKIHSMGEPLPQSMAGRFGDSTTWGEALHYRTSNQRPKLPYSGTNKSPRIPRRNH